MKVVMKVKDKITDALRLFLIFVKIGLFTFGGGYAMISLLDNETVERRKWLTSDEFMKIVAVAETTPGPIAINMATYIGYKQNKLLGAFFATFGVVLPSFVIIYVISLFFDRLLEIEIIANAFSGIKVGVAVLILFAGVKLLKDVEKKPLYIILLVVTVAACLAINVLSLRFSTLFFILIGGAIGYVVYLVEKKCVPTESEPKDGEGGQ
jgi:Chromate transport protein ChrA